VQVLSNDTAKVAVDDGITPSQESTLSGVVDAHINFPLQPTPATSGVFIHTINGTSGVITIDITNDGVTTTKTQLTPAEALIELTPMFDSSSGLLLNTVSDLVASGVVNRLNGLSGLVTIASGVNTALTIETNEASGIIIDVDITRLEDLLTLSGITKLETSTEVPFADSTSTSYVEVVSLPWNVPSSGTYRAQWSFQGACSQANKQVQFRIQLDDSVLVSDLMDISTTFNVAAGNLQFGGFSQFGLDTGYHMLDFDFRFADTGGGAVEVSKLRLEILQITVAQNG
jgi:hypothetical protein